MVDGGLLLLNVDLVPWDIVEVEFVEGHPFDPGSHYVNLILEEGDNDRALVSDQLLSLLAKLRSLGQVELCTGVIQQLINLLVAPVALSPTGPAAEALVEDLIGRSLTPVAAHNA